MIIRPAHAEDCRSIVTLHVQAWKESYRDIIDQSYLDSLHVSATRQEWRNNFFKENSLRKSFVADQSKTIVGFIDIGPSRDPHLAAGEIYAIYLSQKHQSKGIGKQLWDIAVDHLRENQLTPFMAWALEQNLKARAFYERLGGKLATNKNNDIGGKLYSEVCYMFE